MAHAKTGYLPTLDGWRTVAILAVLMDHVFGFDLQSRFPMAFAVTRIGPNGVSLFFAISGFLITSRLLEEQRRDGRVSLRGFYIRRATRILPPAFVYLAVLALFSAAGILIVTSPELWSCVFFFRNYLPLHAITHGWGAYTIHYWSLAVEEHFYLLWPALFFFGGPKRAKWIAPALALAVAVWRSWDLRHGFVESHLPGLLYGSRTDIRLDGLLLGCLAALLLSDADWRRRLVRASNVWVWTALAASYITWQIVFRRHYYTIFESVVLAILVATTVINPGTWVGRFLELPWMRWIGRLSYSLYLWQQLFLVPEAKYPWSWMQKFPVNLILLIVVAYLSYRFVERPMIRLGHKLAPPPTPGREDLESPPESHRPGLLDPNPASPGR